MNFSYFSHFSHLQYDSWSNMKQFDTKIRDKQVTDHTLILFYNTMWGQPLCLEGVDLPKGCELTTDSDRFEEATAVVFHIPDLVRIDELIKPPGQLWVAWSMEAKNHYPRLQDPVFMKQFDLTMTYHLDADVPVSYLQYDNPDIDAAFRAEPKPKTQDKLAALFMSGNYDRSNRTVYVKELMRYLDIHSYGRCLRNRDLKEDKGRSTKLETIANYKFTLCFENSLAKDYVTEKFFDPLFAGSVPVYSGAPNVDEFAPGKHCFINIANFNTPETLAAYLQMLGRDDAAYNEYHQWRQKPLQDNFIRILNEQHEPAFVRLCRKVLELKRTMSIKPESRSMPRTKAPFSTRKHAPGSTDYQTDIPKILHQTWKEEELPQNLASLSLTWKTFHPDWEFRLWTDEDNREFLRNHYSWFLPIYDNYPEHIMRVDAVRYFILYHFGGGYADLDVECLRPLGPLLEGKQVLFGLENPAHLALQEARDRLLTKIVGNAFMASVPKHPFWGNVFRQLIACHRFTGPLDATGPFMITKAYDGYSGKEKISLEPSELLYPISNEIPWFELPAEKRGLISQTAYAIHHWHCSWGRKRSEIREGELVKISLLVKGERVNASVLHIDRCLTLVNQAAESPRISCLMVTRNRAEMARQAVRCFQGQTYSDRELVIVDDGEEESLQQLVEECDDERIVYIRLPDNGKPLGELRNLAVKNASGAYLAQWDDDDLSDPMRLEIQMAAIYLFQTDACFLERQQIWWPNAQRLALSNRRIWEGSFVCAKDILPCYPTLRQGEDTPVIEQIVEAGRAILLDYPSLYTYIFHGNNTFDASHWEQHWQAATKSYEGDIYRIKLQKLLERHMLDVPYPAEKIPRMDGQFSQESITSRIGSEEKPTLVHPVGGNPPKILILVPVKDAVPFLPIFYNNLKTLSYPHGRISLAFLESDSIDGTYTHIEQNLPSLQDEFADVKLFKRDYSYRPDLPRYAPVLQYKRRSIMAKSRNHLLSLSLEDEEWVLWIDVDVARWSDNVIEQLLEVEKEIVVPNCLNCADSVTFDYNTFKLKPGAEDMDWSSFIMDGILQPPKGYGRLYLSDMRQYNCVKIDAVGGTMLLVRADIHREGLVFPSFSYKGYIETEGLAFMAKDMGYKCWGLPSLEIFHP